MKWGEASHDPSDEMMVPMHHQTELSELYAENKDNFDGLAWEDL